MSDLTERVAREMCKADGRDPEECVIGSGKTLSDGTRQHECYDVLWERYLPRARAAIAFLFEEAAQRLERIPNGSHPSEYAAAIRAMKETDDG